MKTTDFASIVTKIRVWESRLLTKPFYERLIDTENLDGALKLLSETYYGHYLEGKNFEAALNKAFKDMYDELYEITPYKEIIDFMRVKYDYHNIKTLIKGKILDKDFSSILIPMGILDIDLLKTALSKENYAELPNIMSEAIKTALDDFENIKDPQRIDIILDRYMFIHMKNLVQILNNSFLEGYVTTLIDLTNIKTILRIKSLNKPLNFLKEVLLDGGELDSSLLKELFLEDYSLIPNKLAHKNYGLMIKESIETFLRTNSLSSFEKNIDDYIMGYMKDSKLINIGPEPIAVFIYARETEIKNLRIILVSKLNNVSKELIKERLRDSYV
ncbi:V-type ATP synthase subunit C [Clostridium prolinivorans]|uniref:V-type ATP synthase subunit C n=1 Tax=Clostridium prolinivorans TaxID=2769420 RepID=UPI000FDCC71A|nr:V-type ATP synthase subunit C [Clostridium prolinivorans]